MRSFTPVGGLLDALVAAGLHDDVARLTARFTSAHEDLEEADRALAVLESAQERLRVMLVDLESLAAAVQGALAVEWRSEAAAEYGERTDGLHRTAVDRVAEAREWLGLVAAAVREAEDARRDARRRLDEAEATAALALRMMAVAA